MTDSHTWIWACTKRLAELHPGEPMALEDWEAIATDLYANAADGASPNDAAETYTRSPVARPPDEA